MCILVRSVSGSLRRKPLQRRMRRDLASFHCKGHAPSPSPLADDLQAHPSSLSFIFIILVLMRLAENVA